MGGGFSDRVVVRLGVLSAGDRDNLCCFAAHISMAFGQMTMDLCTLGPICGCEHAPCNAWIVVVGLHMDVGGGWVGGVGGLGADAGVQHPPVGMALELPPVTVSLITPCRRRRRAQGAGLDTVAAASGILWRVFTLIITFSHNFLIDTPNIKMRYAAIKVHNLLLYYWDYCLMD